MSKFTQMKSQPRVVGIMATLAALAMGGTAVVNPRPDAVPGDGRARVVQEMVMRRKRKTKARMSRTQRDDERLEENLLAFLRRTSLRNQQRQIRRQLGITSGRQWVRFRKAHQRWLRADGMQLLHQVDRQLATEARAQ